MKLNSRGPSFHAFAEACASGGADRFLSLVRRYRLHWQRRGHGDHLCLYFSIHILVIDRYAAICDSIRLSCIQFVTASVLVSILVPVAGEAVIASKICAAMPYLVFCGIGSSALAFTLQMAAQKYLHPVTATLLMSLESVFALSGSWL